MAEKCTAFLTKIGICESAFIHNKIEIVLLELK